MADCLTCEMVRARDDGRAPLWDSILRTEAWDLVHSYNSALPGWLVLISRRHRAAIHELSDAEAAELGPLLRDVSAALREVTGCVKSYVMQFAEAAEHPHVHFHIVPRMPDQPAERRGPAIIGYLARPESEWVSEEKRDEIARALRAALRGRGW